MKKEYTTPEVLIIRVDDIVTTSGNGENVVTPVLPPMGG